MSTLNGTHRNHWYPFSHQVFVTKWAQVRLGFAAVWMLEKLYFQSFPTSKLRTRDGGQVVRLVSVFLKSIGYLYLFLLWVAFSYPSLSFLLGCLIFSSLACNSSLHVKDITSFPVTDVINMFSEFYLLLKLFITAVVKLESSQE